MGKMHRPPSIPEQALHGHPLLVLLLALPHLHLTLLFQVHLLLVHRLPPLLFLLLVYLDLFLSLRGLRLVAQGGEQFLDLLLVSRRLLLACVHDFLEVLFGLLVLLLVGDEFREVPLVFQVEIRLRVIAEVLILLVQFLQPLLLLPLLLLLLVLDLFLQGLQLRFLDAVLLVEVGPVQEEVFQDAFVDLVLGDVHVFGVLDGFVAVSDEDVEVEQLLVGNLGQPARDVVFAHFEDLLVHEFDRISLHSEVVRELQLHHFFRLQPAQHSDYLKQPLLLSFYGLLDAQLPLDDPALDVFFDFFLQGEKQVAVKMRANEQAVGLGLDLLERVHVFCIQLPLGVLVLEGPNEVREDFIAASQTGLLHQFEEARQEFLARNILAVELIFPAFHFLQVFTVQQVR